MLTVAYLANQFPSPVEPYVADEIAELRSRGVRVIAVSVRKSEESASIEGVDIVLLPISVSTALKGIWLCISRSAVLAPLLFRVAFLGTEGPWCRLKALVHTFLGACLGARLKSSGVQHLHAHHGYFGSWVGMTAAKLMGAGFSFTLHGSDLLLHATYLDAKFANSNFCLTVSEYNRQFIVARYPSAEGKVFVSRLGVDVPAGEREMEASHRDRLTMLSVGRLHAVKDHAFLILCCERLLRLDVPFKCVIAGEGPERSALESLIQQLGLSEHVILLGHVVHQSLDSLYEEADLVALTSRSEGIPLVLMEAMARGKLVLAPNITGVPELVMPGKTGFLYQPGSMQDFVDQLFFIRWMISSEARAQDTPHDSPLSWIRHAARVQVLQNFNRSKNLRNFADFFLNHVVTKGKSIPDENLILQQI